MRLAAHLKRWAQIAVRKAAGEFMVESEDENAFLTDDEEDDAA